jgi:hypothetical protein
MRVTFPRLADHEIAYALVERDDGAVYRLQSGRAGTALPHDIRHLVVERELGVTDGLWGGIAAGAVFRSMRHLRGRRPPHAAERSVELKRKYRERLLRAELLADLVESVAALDDPSPEQIRRLTGTKLAVLQGTEPSPEALTTAARALQVEAARWARLRPGEALRYEWPSPRVRIPRQVRYPGSALLPGILACAGAAGRDKLGE